MILDFAKIKVPITQLLKKDIRFVWTDACRKAFEELRSKLSIYTVLRPPYWKRNFHVSCNDNNIAVGSALSRSTGENGNDQPIAYASK